MLVWIILVLVYSGVSGYNYRRSYYSPMMGDRLTNRSVNEHFTKDFSVRITNTFKKYFFVFGQRTHIRNISFERLSSPSFIPRPRNVSPEQEEDERGPMPTSAIKDILKKWVDVRAMVLEWHPNQADVSRVGDLYNDNAINYFRKILKKREKQSTLDMFFNAP
ncbi:uncharacterized protein TNCV_844611 [Trichonephila clavipes]|uniref:Secreted protein n=1 Tax=Trichonephila clavipes TaxID=2585209 RepID=A0A8X6WGQ2_TRICX|nr:uncharacterized protein TNCV_844611 [Trichonephila clavipes]